MDFTKIFKMQVELDKAIKKAHNISSDEVIWERRLVALLVELGEFANEFAPFKYWKKNKIIDRSKLLEEFVDGIHFLSSMAIEKNVAPVIEPVIISDDLSIQLLEIFHASANLKQEYNLQKVERAFALYLGIAKQLQITDQEIEEVYMNKNALNYERIANNY